MTHILYEKDTLFGAAEIHKRHGDAPQIALWSLDLTPEGQPAHGAFSSVLTPAASVTSVQAGDTHDTLRLVVQTTDANEQLYVVFDLASGTVRSATQLLTSTVTFGPVISLLGANDEALLVPSSKSTTYSTSQSYRFFYTRFEQQHSEESEEQGTSLEACDWQHVLESLHIAFELQETLRFEVEELIPSTTAGYQGQSQRRSY